MKYSEFFERDIEELPPVLFVNGDHFWARRMQERLSSLVDDLDLLVVTAVEDVREGLDKAQSFSMFSPKRVVIMKVFEKLKEADKTALKNYASDPSPYSVVLLVGEEFKKVCDYEEIDCSVNDRTAMQAEIESALAQNSCSASTQAISTMIDYCEGDMGKIIAECNKLAAYVGYGGKVEQEDVQTCVTPDITYKIYQLGDMVVKGKYVDCYDLVNRLGLEPTVILANLTKYFRNVFYAKIYGGSKDELAKLLQIKAYPLTLASKTANAYSSMALYELLKLFYKLEYDVKTGATTGEEAMELAFAQAIERRKNK